MHEFLTQRVPGYLAPDGQVALAADVIHSAAELLQFSERHALERGVAAIRQQLLSLVSAGVLAELTFAFHDADSVCGVTVTFDPYNMEDFAEVDLSRLRLAASPTATGSVEIVCHDGAVTDAFFQVDWLPPAHHNLAWYQLQHGENHEDTHLLGDKR